MHDICEAFDLPCGTGTGTFAAPGKAGKARLQLPPNREKHGDPAKRRRHRERALRMVRRDWHARWAAIFAALEFDDTEVLADAPPPQ